MANLFKKQTTNKNTHTPIDCVLFGIRQQHLYRWNFSI